MNKINIQEMAYEVLKPYETELRNENVILDPSFYTNGVESKDSIHAYFGAFIDGELAGISALVKYLNTNDKTTKIYHRGSYTFPKFRKQGVWNALMEYKIRYCHEKQLNPNDKISHHVNCDLADSRYRNDGWHLYTAKEIQLKEKKLYQATWFLEWGELKKLYNIIT